MVIKDREDNGDVVNRACLGCDLEKEKSDIKSSYERRFPSENVRKLKAFVRIKEWACFLVRRLIGEGDC